MKALQAYIDEKNRWAQLFDNFETLVIPTNMAEAEPIFSNLECDLSPENLCCDGEASPAFVRKRAKGLWKVHAELEAIVGERELLI